MSKIEKQSAALAVFKANLLADDHRAKAIEIAKSQFETLVSHRRQAPYRAIALGILLHQLKAGCQHGEWMGTYEQILKSLKFVTEGTARVYASQYMRLASTFLTEADAAKPEFIQLSVNQTEISKDTGNATEKAFAKKLESFIGDRSLDELLTDYDLRNAAATKRRKLAAEENAAVSDAAEMSAQDLFNEMEEHLQLARKSAADKGVWMRLSKQHHKDLMETAGETYQRIKAQYEKTHGALKK